MWIGQRGRRGCVVPLASSRRSAASRRWQAASARASGTCPASDWREVEDASAPGGLGCLTGPPAGQVSGLPGRFLSPFLFSILFLCFDLNLATV